MNKPPKLAENPGFIVGLVVGAGLFYATIQLVSALMFSRTAA